MAEHPCPGCPRTVPEHLVACPQCWQRIPIGLRRATTAAYENRAADPVTHGRFRVRAQRWLRDHPPRATRAVHASMNRPNPLPRKGNP